VGEKAVGELVSFCSTGRVSSQESERKRSVEEVAECQECRAGCGKSEREQSCDELGMSVSEKARRMRAFEDLHECHGYSRRPSDTLSMPSGRRPNHHAAAP